MVLVARSIDSMEKQLSKLMNQYNKEYKQHLMSPTSYSAGKCAELNDKINELRYKINMRLGRVRY